MLSDPAALASFSLRGLTTSWQSFAKGSSPPPLPKLTCPLKGRLGGRASERLELQEGRASLLEPAGRRKEKRKERQGDLQACPVRGGGGGGHGEGDISQSMQDCFTGQAQCQIFAIVSKQLLQIPRRFSLE